MGKNKAPAEQRTNRAGETQKLGGKKSVPRGADRQGGRNPK